jgi:hypothetical protein
MQIEGFQSTKNCIRFWLQRFASRSWDAKRPGCVTPKAAKQIKAPEGDKRIY